MGIVDADDELGFVGELELGVLGGGLELVEFEGVEGVGVGGALFENVFEVGDDLGGLVDAELEAGEVGGKEVLVVGDGLGGGGADGFEEDGDAEVVLEEFV